MPAAIVAGWSFVVAAIAIQGPAAEKLFQPAAIFRRKIARLERQRELVATAITVAGVEARQEWRVMVVNAARHDARAVAERTRNRKLGGDRFADECALIGKLVEKLRKLF